MEYFARAEGHRASREFVHAVKEYDSCIQVFQSISELTLSERELLAKAYNNRGQSKYQLVEFFDAISDYTSAININPEYSIAFYNRGLIHYRLGQYTKAIKDFERALKIQPAFGDAILAKDTALQEQQLNGDRNWPGYCE